MGQVFLWRSISGAGKSTAIANQWNDMTKGGEPGPYSVLPIFSADNYFIDDTTGKYEFVKSKLGEAHSWCFRMFLEAIYLQTSPYYVVDNTNIKLVDLAPYVQVAGAYGHECEIITIWCDPMVAFKRNVHKVPLETIMWQYQNLLKEIIPSYWKHRSQLAWEGNN